MWEQRNLIQHGTRLGRSAMIFWKSSHYLAIIWQDSKFLMKHFLLLPTFSRLPQRRPGLTLLSVSIWTFSIITSFLNPQININCPCYPWNLLTNYQTLKRNALLTNAFWRKQIVQTQVLMGHISTLRNLFNSSFLASF